MKFSNTPLSRTDLEKSLKGGCEIPNCTHPDHHATKQFFLMPLCHPEADLSVSYKTGTGLLFIQCAKCQTVVAQIMVAGPGSLAAEESFAG